MNIRPLADRVVVKPLQEEEVVIGWCFSVSGTRQRF